MEYRLNNYVLPGPLQPLNNQALVKMRAIQEQTGGGLFVPTEDTEKPKEGLVIAAGPGVTHPESGKLLANPVKEGDLVLLSDFNGEKVEYNGESHMFVDASTLLGMFENKEMTASAFRPLGDRVMVEMSAAATETTTGIALALDDDDEANSGEVVAVGAGAAQANGELKPIGIKAGESVMYARYAGSEAKMDGKRFAIVQEKDCIAKWSTA